MSTSTSIQNFVMDQGVDWSVTIDMFDDAGLPLDLSGATAVALMRPHYESETNYPITVTTFNGGIRLSMSAAANSVIEPQRYVYDVIITDTFTQKTKPLKGRIRLDPAASV